MSLNISYISEFVPFIRLDWILIPDQGTLWAYNGVQLKASSNWQKTFYVPLPKKKKIFCKVSRSPVRLPLYCKIILGNIWLGNNIWNHFILKAVEREDVNKHVCRLLFDSQPLDNMAINFGCTPARSNESLALIRGVIWWAYALNMVGLRPEHGGLMP